MPSLGDGAVSPAGAATRLHGGHARPPGGGAGWQQKSAHPGRAEWSLARSLGSGSRRLRAAPQPGIHAVERLDGLLHQISHPFTTTRSCWRDEPSAPVIFHTPLVPMPVPLTLEHVSGVREDTAVLTAHMEIRTPASYQGKDWLISAQTIRVAATG